MALCMYLFPIRISNPLPPPLLGIWFLIHAEICIKPVLVKSPPADCASASANKAILNGMSEWIVQIYPQHYHPAPPPPSTHPSTPKKVIKIVPLQWRHNERDGVSNHRRIDCSGVRRKSKKTLKLRTTGLCKGNPPVIDGLWFPLTSGQ